MRNHSQMSKLRPKRTNIVEEDVGIEPTGRFKADLQFSKLLHYRSANPPFVSTSEREQPTV